MSSAGPRTLIRLLRTPLGRDRRAHRADRRLRRPRAQERADQLRGLARHVARGAQAAAREAGVDFVNISPMRRRYRRPPGRALIAPRPNTDAALMMGLAHEMIAAGSHDRQFLRECCVGGEQLEAYLTGARDGVRRDAAWAAAICDVERSAIEELAAEMSARRTLVTRQLVAAARRSRRAAVLGAIALAAMLGQIGLPGGGFGIGYGAITGSAQPARRPGPTLPGRNGVDRVHAGRAHRGHAAGAGHGDRLRRQRDHLPGHPPRLLVRRQSVPSPPGSQPAGARMAQARDHDRARVVVEPDRALRRHRLPRRDRARAQRRRRRVGRSWISSMQRAVAPPPARCATTTRPLRARRPARLPRGVLRGPRRRPVGALSTSRRARTCGARAWSCPASRSSGTQDGSRSRRRRAIAMLDFAALRADPAASPLPTPSGRIELASARSRPSAMTTAPAIRSGSSPRNGWDRELARRFPLHLISNQPSRACTRSTTTAATARSPRSTGASRSWLHPDDAAPRGIADGDIVRVFNDRGAIWRARCSTRAGAARSCSSRPARGGIPCHPGDPGGARPPWQPERPDARQGHLAARPGPERADDARGGRALRGAGAADRGLFAARADRARPVRIELAYGSEGLDRRPPGRPHDGRRAAASSGRGRRARRARGAAPARRRPAAARGRARPARRSPSASATARARSRARIVVPAILEELEGLVRLEDIVVLVATGTHRGNTDEELRAMLGDEVLEAVRVVNHDARDERR